MSDIFPVGLLLLDTTPAGLKARDELAAALGGADLSAADEVGSFEVSVSAQSREEALHKVWNAVAAAGADDHLVFLEHPDIPRHWQRRERPAA